MKSSDLTDNYSKVCGTIKKVNVSDLNGVEWSFLLDKVCGSVPGVILQAFDWHELDGLIFNTVFGEKRIAATRVCGKRVFNKKNHYLRSINGIVIAQSRINTDHGQKYQEYVILSRSFRVLYLKLYFKTKTNKAENSAGYLQEIVRLEYIDAGAKVNEKDYQKLLTKLHRIFNKGYVKASLYCFLDKVWLKLNDMKNDFDKMVNKSKTFTTIYTNLSIK